VKVGRWGSWDHVSVRARPRIISSSALLGTPGPVESIGCNVQLVSPQAGSDGNEWIIWPGVP
jgi:hypothetical protein